MRNTSHNDENIMEDILTARRPVKDIIDAHIAERWAIIKNSYALGLTEDRLIVEEDPYKSKYDCQKCNGRKHLGEICKYCKGTKYEKGNEENGYCRDCTVGKAGIGETLGFVPCDLCNGTGGIITVPDENKRNTTTGNILAIGPLVTVFKVNEKVMFTNYTGTPFDFLDTKFRIMSEKDVLCKVKQLKASVEGINSGTFADLDNVGEAHE